MASEPCTIGAAASGNPVAVPSSLEADDAEALAEALGMNEKQTQFVLGLVSALTAAWETGAEHGLERGVKAAFQHGYNYVNQHGPTLHLGNLMLIEREIFERELHKLQGTTPMRETWVSVTVNA